MCCTGILPHVYRRASPAAASAAAQWLMDCNLEHSRHIQPHACCTSSATLSEAGDSPPLPCHAAWQRHLDLSVMTASAHSIDLVSPQVLVRITLRVINPTVRGPLLSTSCAPCTSTEHAFSPTTLTDTRFQMLCTVQDISRRIVLQDSYHSRGDYGGEAPFVTGESGAADPKSRWVEQQLVGNLGSTWSPIYEVIVEQLHLQVAAICTAKTSLQDQPVAWGGHQI